MIFGRRAVAWIAAIRILDMPQTWWIRFELGLPCREVDAKSLLRDIPELRRAGSRRALHLDGGSTLSRLAGWVAEAVEDEPPSDVESYRRCPSNSCPMESERGHSGATSIVTDSGDLIFGFMATNSASSARQSEWNRFLDTVRYAHRGQKSPSNVYVTDPFIMTESGQDKEHREVWNFFLDYLAALNVKPDFKLTMWNGELQNVAEPARRAWHQHLMSKYSKCSVIWPDGKTPTFHDRFYLACGSSAADLSGVFGPSLNGLGSDAIFIMGKIEENVVKAFAELLNRSPKGGRHPAIRR
jgi:hypothetical protein